MHVHATGRHQISHSALSLKMELVWLSASSSNAPDFALFAGVMGTHMVTLGFMDGCRVPSEGSSPLGISLALPSFYNYP